jgi:hypothetical protein
MKTEKPTLRSADDPFFGSPPAGFDRASWQRALVTFSNFFAAETSDSVDSLRAFSFNPDDYIAFVSGLRVESDRAMAVLAFGYLEDQLTAALAYNFKDLSRDLRDELMGSMFKPLGSVSARLKVCLAFGWLSKATYDTVDALRDIRNGFAHGKRAHDFSEKAVSDRLQRFDLSTDEHIGHLIPATLTLRQRFLLLSSAYAIYLPLEIIASKVCQRRSAIGPFLWNVTLPMMGEPFDPMMNALLYVAEHLSKDDATSPSAYRAEERPIMAARIQRRAIENGTLSTIAMRTWSENPTARAITLREAEVALKAAQPKGSSS